MKINHILQALVLTFVLMASGLAIDDKAEQIKFPSDETSSELREGIWVWHSMHHVSWMEIHKVVQIERIDENWYVTFFTLSHTRESFQSRRPPQIETEGPYPVSVTNGILHIQKQKGILKYSCRFYGELLQFPAIVRTNELTFNFTFSEIIKESDSEERIDTWSYIWSCSLDPSREPSGKAVLTVVTPKGKETIACLYTTEKALDGPALAFRKDEENSKGQDLIVWTRSFYGPQIYDSFSPKLKCPGLQMTYRPADDNLKDMIKKEIKKNLNKPDANDCK
jgi:hypothetical protein